MLKKTITFTNPFTEQEVTEDHYFHISKADLVEMEMEEHKAKHTNREGKELTGMEAYISRIIEAEDGKAVMAVFKDLLRRSYGKKEGDRFRKSPEIWAEFESSEAYSTLFFELCTNAGAASAFVNSVIPKGLDKEVAQLAAQAKAAAPPASAGPAEGVKETPALEKAENALGTESDPTGLSTPDATPRVLTQAEMLEMDSDELKSGLATGRYKLS